MLDISDEQFEKLVSTAIDHMPEQYMAAMSNVAITYTDAPSPEQRQRLRLRGNQTLFGLYEGVPRTERQGRQPLLPDKITLFKLPLAAASGTADDLQKQVMHTLWHEIAHYFGLNHQQIQAIEARWH